MVSVVTDLLVSGVGVVVGIVLERLANETGLLEILGDAVSCRCTATAMKHEAFCVLCCG